MYSNYMHNHYLFHILMFSKHMRIYSSGVCGVIGLVARVTILVMRRTYPRFEIVTQCVASSGERSVLQIHDTDPISQPRHKKAH